MSVFDKPIIKYFRASADEVMADEEIMLEWEVENARKVKLDGLEMDKTGNYKMCIYNNRTFELTASNLAFKESQWLTIRLFRPAVLRFETDSATIKEGEFINIYFQVKQAQSWKILAEYGSVMGKKKETIAEGKVDSPMEIFENNISAILKGPCELTLTTKNGSEKGINETVRLFSRKLSLDYFSVSPLVVIRGSLARLTWKVQYFTRLVLNPGNIDITNLTHYDFKVESDRDIQLELKAFGDFGQLAAESKILYVARIENFHSTNNLDINNPEFYLNWSSTGLENFRLLPDNVLVKDIELKYRIPAGAIAQPYTLVAETKNGEEVIETISLHPCSIPHFFLEKGRVIIGTMATLTWEVKNAKNIQLKFADSLKAIDIPPMEPKYHFQVFKGRDKVKLIAWGDINVVESEIPIQAFQSPEIKMLNMSGINLQLGITWKASPVIKPAESINQFYLLKDNSTDSAKNLIWKLWRYISIPSWWLLTITKKSSQNKRVFENGRVKADVIGKRLSSLTELVFSKLAKNLTKEN